MKKNRILAILIVMIIAVFAFASCECAHVYENGACTECGEADPNYCEHEYENGVCTKCEGADPDYVAPCTHEWVNGKCTKCEVKCEHTWVNGACSVCDVECIHIWGNGVCTRCYFACAHEGWESGTCKECRKSCEHSWKDGTCSTCGYACVHSWKEDSICRVCSSICQHNWVDGGCADCKTKCAHTWENGTCTVCALACGHAWENGTCTSCALNCTHTWENGVCTVCTLPCTHTWENGTCTVCTLACTHTWENGVCTVCTLPCTHTWENGTCTVCTLACTHTWEDGVCTVCTLSCAHEAYENGACVVCAKACVHQWEDGICKVCASECEHAWTEGVCTACGKVDPDYVPADGGKSLYAEIVEKYKHLVLYKFTMEELPPEEAEPAYYDAALRYVANYYVPTTDLGYAYKDINGDGYLELLLMGKDSRLYGLFTIADRKPVVVATFQEGMGYLDDTGLVFSHEKRFVDGTTDQIGLTYRFERLVDGKLVGTGFGWDDGDGNYETEDDEVYFKLENGEKVTIDYDTEYKVLKDHTYEYFTGYPTRLTKLASLHYQTALVEQVVATEKADFSSYEAIIKTFTYMRANAPSNKNFNKTMWLAGDYDNLMLFDTYEDYVIYNRIVSSAGFISSGSSAKCGYVVKDLNGDGVDELILMDSYGSGSSAKLGVFAIFTLADGKPVLLDCYTDLKFAFINANGNIVVCNRPVQCESGKKDREFIVYTIENGALKVVEKYGYLCDTTTTGAKNTWYKVVDGERVIIEEDEFDEWFDANVKVAGSSASIANFSKYTAKASGLEFVELVLE